MRVVYICWSYPSEIHPADGSFFRNQVEGLCAAGVEVTVVVPVPYVPRICGRVSFLRRYTELPLAYEWHGVRVLMPRYPRLPYRIPADLIPHVMAHAIESAVREKADLVHGHYAYPLGKAASLLARRWMARAVVTVHGDDGHSYPYQSRVKRRRFQDAIASADCVLAVSRELIESIAQLTGVRATFWPIGVDLKRFSCRQPQQAARIQLGLPSDREIVLFIGGLIRRKGVDVLVEAARHLRRHAVVVLVGDGPYRELVRNAPGCMWVPPVSNDLIPQYLSAADMMVLPSRREGTPTVLVEAGAMGVPIVATAVSGIPDLLAEDRGVLISPENVYELLAGIERVLQDRESGLGRAEALREYVHEHYDAAKNSRRLRTLYESLVQGTEGDTGIAARASGA